MADSLWQGVIKSLDLANDRLQSTLASLRKTTVNPNFGSSQYGSFGASENEEVKDIESSSRPLVGGTAKTLHDFIDESSHTGLLDRLRSLIDAYNDAKAVLYSSQHAIQESLQSLARVLASINPPPDTSDDAEPRTTAALFHSLTAHATETASLLQSLIAHYDLCVTALKHTEGGSEAAREAADSTTNAEDQDTAETIIEESLYHNKIREPISTEERIEMLNILDNDAQEVEDVVHEISERLSEMETQLGLLADKAKSATSQHVTLSRVLNDMKQVGETLPHHITTARDFRTTWSGLRHEIASKTEELSSLSTFYDSFVHSYASLIREVERRKMVESKMRKIADRAKRDLEALYAEDVDMREQFLREVGEYLPRDIWPGLVDAPRRWEINMSGDGEEIQIATLSKDGQASG